MKKYLKTSLVCLGLALCLPTAIAMDDSFDSHSSSGSTKSQERLWKKRGVPHRGWTDESEIDLGERIGVCEMCGTRHRYQHIMSHPSHPNVKAGRICAGKMTQEYVDKAE